MTARDDAAGRHEIFPVVVLEVDRDTCLNSYGVAPCTAAAGVGGECYYAYGSCQDKANYARGVVTDRFCSTGMPVPVGETIRPYIDNLNSTPTEIVPGKGLAMRGETSLTLIDEVCADHLDDRHYATRPAAAAGTFWGRYLARNKHLVGRPARVRRGYLTTPFDWATFQTELYVITGVSGPDGSGKIRMKLHDQTKLLDAVKIPVPSSGKLAAALKAASHVGVVVSATSTTVVLPSTGSGAASAVDDAYNGQELWIYSNTGSGQRRVISDYVGATRTATVAAWAVVPDSTSSYEIGVLGLALDSGSGADYADPATSGKPEFVRVGSEIIRYTALIGDVLTWPETTYRAQFGSAIDDHKADDMVQLCRAFIDQPAAAVVQALLNEGSIADGIIDLAGLNSECTTWLSGLLITDCLTTPEAVSSLLADLLIDLSASMWWDAVGQLVRYKANMPEISGTIGLLTDADPALKSVKVDPLDKDRITSQTIYYGLADATEDRKKNANYLRGKGYIDAAAKSLNEYGDDRPAVRLSHWLSTANSVHAGAWCGRQVARLRDAPTKISFKVLPRNEQQLGRLVNLQLRAVVDEAGQPKVVQVRVVKVEMNDGIQDVSCLTTAFGKRYAFIAPNGLPNYTAASDDDRNYAFICTTATQKMGNGDDPYLII